MWKPWEWSARSNEQAIVNARAATTECSRRTLERAEVALYLSTAATTLRTSKTPA